MQKVGVRGADNTVKNLALVRRAHGVTYVCPIDRYTEAMSGDDQSVVGFPDKDVGEPIRELSL